MAAYPIQIKSSNSHNRSVALRQNDIRQQRENVMQKLNKIQHCHSSYLGLSKGEQYCELSQ